MRVKCVFLLFTTKSPVCGPSVTRCPPTPPPQALCSSTTLGHEGPREAAGSFLPVHLIPREPAPNFQAHWRREGGREARWEPGSCPRGMALMKFLPGSTRSQARIYSLCPQKLGLQTKHPTAVSLSRPAGGGFSELHPPICEMGAIARSEASSERAQMKPSGGRLQPESLWVKFGWKSTNRGTCWGWQGGERALVWLGSMLTTGRSGPLD